MLPGLGELALLAVLILALALFAGTIAWHRLRQEVIIRRWAQDRHNGVKREAFRRSAVRAKRAEPRLHLYLLIAGLAFAALILDQLIVNVLAAL